MINISEYLTTQTLLPPFLPYPRFLLELNLSQTAKMTYLLQMCSNNLNQYAKVANENGRVYAADMEDLRARLDELISIGKQILSRLAEL